MIEHLRIDFRKHLPVFPLPGCVLLPHVALPLHIFEQRYRQMVADALDSHGLIAMAMFDGAVSQQQYLQGKPALRPHMCVGYISQYEKLPDGRYLLVLCGLCRAKLIEEIDHEPYRMARLEPTEVPLMAESRLADHRRQLNELIRDPSLASVEGVSELVQVLDQSLPTAAVVDLAAVRLCSDVEQQYRLLSESDPRQRVEWLTQWVASQQYESAEDLNELDGVDYDDDDDSPLDPSWN